MTPRDEIVTLRESDWTVSELENFLREHEYRGYPVVKSQEDKLLCGHVLRNDLMVALSKWINCSQKLRLAM